MAIGYSCDKVLLDTSFLKCGKLRDVGAPKTLLSKMLARTDSCDIVFIVEEERLPAHRVVIAAVSTPFEKLLMGPMKEGTSKEIPMREISKLIWGLVLNFICSGRLEIENHADALELARFADMYEINGLLDWIEKYLAEHFLDLLKKDNF